jgi:retron-type reverse transcriptase
MKRIGNLFDQVTDYQTLLLAFRRARRGTGWTAETRHFFFHLEPELLRLQETLETGRYRPGAYRYFPIRDPKPRLIAVAPFRDRVVHHAIVHALEPVYERCFIHDSYATRPGKGTHAAIRRAQTFARRWPWYLKMDIEKYFESADHGVLLGLLERKLKDRRLLALLERIIHNGAISGRGLPIGNLTSQFLANVYLDPLDHYLKEEQGVRGYLRYMDDFVAFGENKQELLTLRHTIGDYLTERLRLRLKIDATWLNRSSHGLSFLGMRVFPNLIRVKPENRRRSLKRLQRRLAQWAAGEIDDARLAQSLTSIQAHLGYFSRA